MSKTSYKIETWMYVGDGKDHDSDYPITFGQVISVGSFDTEILNGHYCHPKVWNPKEAWKKLDFNDYLTQAEQC